MNRLRETRQQKRMTQIQIYKKTGIWPSRISYIENGYMDAKEKEKILLSKAVGAAKDWLFPEK